MMIIQLTTTMRTIRKITKYTLSPHDGYSKLSDTDMLYTIGILGLDKRVVIKLVSVQKGPKEIQEIVEVQVKYEGYINKTLKEVDRMLKLEDKKIPEDIDYDKVNNLASEARQKLKQVRPLTIAQATRISGVNPADISILTVYLKKEYANQD